MISPEFPPNEFLRQKAVEKYRLLDTLPEDSYDAITSIIASICRVPISLVTLLDKNRNFLKSHHGIPFSESPREISFCGHAITQPEPIMIVEDAREDERFKDNPLVEEHSAIFYAGVPLVNPEGYKLGTLCIYDTKPKKLSDTEKEALINLAKQVVNLFEQRIQNFELTKLQEELKLRNEELEKFAALVSHDLKSPLGQIYTISELLGHELKQVQNTEVADYLDLLKQSTTSMSSYIDGMLNYYKNNSDTSKKEFIDLERLIKEVIAITGARSLSYSFGSDINKSAFYVDKIALQQIFVNLVTNSIKYNDKSTCEISLNITQKENNYFFELSDNGPGIDPKYQDNIFDLFFTVPNEKSGLKGLGFGLATVKRLLTKLEGSIRLVPTSKEGAHFEIVIPK